MLGYRKGMLVAAVLALIVDACGTERARAPAGATSEAKETPAGFPSFNPSFGPPPGWGGPVFQLSQSYPDTLSKERPPFLDIDFMKDPGQYLMKVREYVYQGNIDRGTDSAGNTLDWIVQRNPVRTWYHMPWRDYGSRGREFVHGLTMEFPSQPHYLDPNQAAKHFTWAKAMYNPIAAYTLGQVWPDPAKGPTMSAGRFAPGSTIAKLLFTTADSTDVPEVQGTYVWQANTYANPACDTLPCPRTAQPVRLIQMDVAMKDPRAPVTQWVFGTFVYDKDAPGGSVWEKMVPLGLMWGNDPQVTSTSRDSTLQESRILQVKMFEHLGCHGRLSGPLDNPRSACMSCHMTAQFPGAAAVPPSSSACDSPANAKFWQNLAPGMPFQTFGDTTTTAFDFSMEMASSVENYMAARQHPVFSPDGRTYVLPGHQVPHQAVRREN
jgi:hypothetical protein